jgi:peptide/nickel transport system permease protein
VVAPVSALFRSPLTWYIVRRLAGIAALLLVVSFAAFSLLYLTPGDPVTILLGANPHTPADVQALREKYHLNEPLLTQYWFWLRNAIHLNFGQSIQATLPVSEEIKSSLGISAFLALYAFVITTVAGIGLGIVAAFRRERALDRAVVAGGVMGLSTPAFVSSLVLLYLFAVVFRWFPVFGPGSGFGDRLYHLTLPALALALTTTAYLIKHTRAAMINVLDQDYVTFTRSRGLSPRRVLFAYSLRNALMPIVTLAGPLLAYLVTGAVLVESTFTLPGIGGLLVQSALNKDVPVLQGVTITVAVLILGANLIVDLLYLVIDPRIRLRSSVK